MARISCTAPRSSRTCCSIFNCVSSLATLSARFNARKSSLAFAKLLFQVRPAPAMSSSLASTSRSRCCLNCSRAVLCRFDSLLNSCRNVSISPPRCLSCSIVASRLFSRRRKASAMSSRSSPIEVFRAPASSSSSPCKRPKLFSNTVVSRWRALVSSVKVSETLESSKTNSLYCSIRHFMASSVASRSCCHFPSITDMASARCPRSSTTRAWTFSSAFDIASSILRRSTEITAINSSFLAWICLPTSSSPAARCRISLSSFSCNSPKRRSKPFSLDSAAWCIWSNRTCCSFTASSMLASPV
mmetsp:Transcript_75945/g.191115  ORF Transcript_75945/g.191115 Transcript_75945/m.191115 type:complete len:301 (+) Transcript_75945:3444-4346(+)